MTKTKKKEKNVAMGYFCPKWRKDFVPNFLSFFSLPSLHALSFESFGLILQNLKLICVIGTVGSYLADWGERQIGRASCRERV